MDQLPRYTMERLPENPSKAEELAHWQEFLAQLPPCSYLAMFLAESTGPLESAMRADISTELISDLRKRRGEALAEMVKARADLDSVTEATQEQRKFLRLTKHELVKAREELAELRKPLRTLLASVDNAHAMACNAVLKVGAA